MGGLRGVLPTCRLFNCGNKMAAVDIAVTRTKTARSALSATTATWKLSVIIVLVKLDVIQCKGNDGNNSVVLARSILYRGMNKLLLGVR